MGKGASNRYLGLYVLAGERFHSARLRPRVGRGGAADPAPFGGGDDPVEGEVDDVLPDTEMPTQEGGEPTPEGGEPGLPDSPPVEGPPEDPAG